MRNLKFHIGYLLLTLFLFSACSSPYFSSLFATMEECQLVGMVKDEAGNPIEGVTIISGREKFSTNVRGVFMLDKAKVENDRCVLKFQKEGYCSVTRSCVMDSAMQMDVVMLQKNGSKVHAQHKFSTGTTAVVNVGKMSAKISGKIVTSLGIEYSGEVVADLFYLDPNSDNFQAAMPGGDLEAVRSDNSNTFLKSYGMVDVSLSDKNGNSLQLGEGAEAELTFPIPAGMEQNAPAEIPLWAFNEDKGIWEEEGMAVYDATNKVYRGQVKHFSWHNLDVPSERVTVKGKVEDCNGSAVEGVKVIVGQTSTYTDKEGRYSVYIPQNTDVDIYVRSADYYNYKEGKRQKLSGTTDAEVEAPLISLPCLNKLSGRIKNSCGGKPLALAYIDYRINKELYTSTPIWSNPNDGTFSILFPKGASALMLHIESNGGSAVPRPYMVATDDIDCGEIEICMESQPQEVLHVTYGEKTMDFNVNEKTLDVASDIGGLMGALTEVFSAMGGTKIEYSPRFITITSEDGESVVTIQVKNFIEGVNTYDAEVSFVTGNIFAKGDGYFTVVEHKDEKTLLTFACALTAENGGTPVTVSGIFSIPDMVNGVKLMGGIAHFPDACPSLPKPILSTFQYHIDEHWITGGLYSESVDYEVYKAKLLKAGAVCLKEESDDDSKSGIFYHKDYMVLVSGIRILVMDKPTDKEEHNYVVTSMQKGKRNSQNEKGFEIEMLENKAIMQTLSVYPVYLEVK